MITVAIAGNAQRTASPRPLRTKSKVKHLYWWEDGEVARELGVDVRGLCGFWFPMRRGVEGIKIKPEEIAPRHCKRCAAVYRAAEKHGGRLIR